MNAHLSTRSKAIHALMTRHYATREVTLTQGPCLFNMPLKYNEVISDQHRLVINTHQLVNTQDLNQGGVGAAKPF